MERNAIKHQIRLKLDEMKQTVHPKRDSKLKNSSVIQLRKLKSNVTGEKFSCDKSKMNKIQCFGRKILIWKWKFQRAWLWK